MFTILKNIYSKIFFQSSKINLYNPKGLNVFFNNGMTQKYTFINLNDIQSISFEIRKTDSCHQLYVILLKNGTTEILLENFVNENDAKKALDLLKINLLSPEKHLLKITLFVGIVVFIWSVALDVALISKNKLSAKANNTVENVKISNNKNPSEAELQNLMNSVQNQIQTLQSLNPQQIPNNNPIPPQQDPTQPQQAGDPFTQNLLNSLGK